MAAEENKATNSVNVLGANKPLLGRKSASGRLPTLKGPRDLTLGGAAKKTFVPNLIGRKEKIEPKIESPKASNRGRGDQRGIGDGRGGRRGRGEGRGRGDGRGRGGRGRARETIQSRGVFEEGPGLNPVSSNAERAPRYESSSQRVSSTSRVQVKQEVTPEKSEEALKYLLRDDFVDNDQLTGSTDPITLPMATDSETAVKPDTAEEASQISELFEKPPDSGAGDLLLLQLPSYLPGLPPCRDEASTIKREPNQPPAEPATSAAQPKAAGVQLAQTPGRYSCDTGEEPSCLGSFSEGRIGRLCKHRSGRVTLRLGDVTFLITPGTDSPFCEDVIGIASSSDGTGVLHQLGSLKQKLVAEPDILSMLENSNLS